MGHRRSRMSYTPRRRSARSSSGPGLIGAIFVIFIALVVLGMFVQFLQTPSGVAFALVVIASVVAFFVWRNYKRNQQRQAWLIQQQQQAAWNQHQQQMQWQQQQEAARQQYARQEQDRCYEECVLIEMKAC